jgi:hypothetical protein
MTQINLARVREPCSTVGHGSQNGRRRANSKGIIQCFTPSKPARLRPLPADHVLLGMVCLFLDTWGEFSHVGRDDYDRECSPLVRAIASTKATTDEGLSAKGAVVKVRLLGETMAEMVEAGADEDTALLLSFAADALALTEVDKTELHSFALDEKERRRIVYRRYDLLPPMDQSHRRSLSARRLWRTTPLPPMCTGGEKMACQPRGTRLSSCRRHRRLDLSSSKRRTMTCRCTAISSAFGN